MLLITILPIILLLYYFYRQDKFEKEPLKKLLECFIVGIAITLQIQYIEDKLLMFNNNIIYQCFIVAALTEESAKFLAIRFTIYKDNEMDEQVDCIIYCVFLSLGFALVENFVLTNSFSVGLVRGFTAIPAHALFAVTMGYYLGKYKFNGKTVDLIKAIIYPIALHGIYDSLIMLDMKFGLFLFVPYIAFLWVLATKDTEICLEKSKFRRSIK